MGTPSRRTSNRPPEDGRSFTEASGYLERISAASLAARGSYVQTVQYSIVMFIARLPGNWKPELGASRNVPLRRARDRREAKAAARGVRPVRRRPSRLQAGGHHPAGRHHRGVPSPAPLPFRGRLWTPSWTTSQLSRGSPRSVKEDTAVSSSALDNAVQPLRPRPPRRARRAAGCLALVMRPAPGDIRRRSRARCSRRYRGHREPRPWPPVRHR